MNGHVLRLVLDVFIFSSFVTFLSTCVSSIKPFNATTLLFQPIVIWWLDFWPIVIWWFDFWPIAVVLHS
jgi:hypothetical protein